MAAPTPANVEPKKAKPQAPAEDDQAFKIARYFRQVVKGFAPHARLPADTPAGLTSWMGEFHIMLDTHKRSPPDVKRVIDHLAVTPFWQPHILSPRKLKEKFDTLLIQGNQSKRGASHGSYPSLSAPTRRRATPASQTSVERRSCEGDDE